MSFFSETTGRIIYPNQYHSRAFLCYIRNWRFNFIFEIQKSDTICLSECFAHSYQQVRILYSYWLIIKITWPTSYGGVHRSLRKKYHIGVKGLISIKLLIVWYDKLMTSHINQTSGWHSILSSKNSFVEWDLSFEWHLTKQTTVINLHLMYTPVALLLTSYLTS